VSKLKFFDKPETETVFLREAATAGTNAHTIFGGENHFKL
jgi:hypothetical protein